MFFKQNRFDVALMSARLAQSVEHQTLNLRVVGSSPTLGEAFIRYRLPLIQSYVVNVGNEFDRTRQ